MKYQIKCGNDILYDLREDEFTLENPVLNLEINKTGNLTFTIYPDHPYFDRIYKLSSVITVLKDDIVIFKGRVIGDEQGIYNSKNIECEGILGYLNDSIVRPYTFSGDPSDFHKYLFNNHNGQALRSLVEKEKLTNSYDVNGNSTSDIYELEVGPNSIKQTLLQTDNNDFAAQIILTGLETNTNYYIYGNPSSNQFNRVYIYTDNVWGTNLTTKTISTSGASFNTGNNTSLVLGFYSTSNVTVGEIRTITDLYITKGEIDRTKELKIGTITVTDPNNYISRSSINYSNTWKVLNEDLIEKLGGYLKIRYESDGTYIDYLSDFSDTSTQVIEFGENLIDVLVKNDAAEVYTVVIPLGAEIESEDETKERLNIKSVNNGLDYLVNETAFNSYGWIVAPVEDTTWDNVTTAAALKSKGTTYLNNNAVMLKSTFECKALDLNLTDDQIESFFIYEYVRFKSTIHNINEIFLLEKISIPIASPQNMSITLGEETSSLTGIELGNKKNIDNVVTRVGKIENDYIINNEKISDLENSIEYFSVDLSQYNITIPTDTNKKPLITKNYDINFYGYFKGSQVTPVVTISGTNTGITTSSTSTYVRFSTSSNTAITNSSNEYQLTFTYTIDSSTYTVIKKVVLVISTSGSDGSPGKGITSIQEKYAVSSSNSIAPTTWYNTMQQMTPTNKYLWSYEVITYTDSTTEDTTKRIIGVYGDQGIPGVNGSDGVSTYFYVRYSINSDGNPMTVSPGASSKYMGVASTTSSSAPSSYSAYTWSLIKGSDGINGSPGAAGADGRSSYLHIKYSDDGVTFTSNQGEDVGRYRGELVDFNQTDSTTFSDYTWYDMALLVEEELDSIREEIVTNITSIQNNQEQILMTALEDYVSKDNFETYQNTVSTQFQQTATDFNFNFNNLTSTITNLNGTTQQQFQEISKYIRFVDGNIVLGEVGNEITLTIENDRISFKQNNNEVAYLSNNKLVVLDGEFLYSLTIGNFKWVPRANGNLSLVKIGGV